MNNFFDQLFKIADSGDALDKYLNVNMQLVNEFYNSNYGSILLAKNSIEKFILLKHRNISQLDYTKSYAKSFVLMLLDYCERFNFISATPQIHRILTENNISINFRQNAALHFLYPRPNTNSELVERFDSICENLQLAIDNEEDNDNKAIATFLNYYGIIVNDTPFQFLEQVNKKITNAQNNEEYQFLLTETIKELASIGTQDKDAAYVQVQIIIDKILGKEDVYVYVPINSTEKEDVRQELLIETDTCYSKELIDIPDNYDAIRSLSVRRADGCSLTNRGVKIIESYEELYEYMKRFGNMHKAKLQSAFEPLPNSFPSKVNIIDWGCGQGIASMIFIEKFGADIIHNITLIEPSELAIKRAALHVKKYNQHIPIKTICKKLDELEESDFTEGQADIIVHLFSNILDIDDYSQTHLIDLIECTQSGTNYFVCASPYIDEIKTERLESFKRNFESKYDSFELLLDVSSSKNPNDDFWCCNNTHNKHRISHGTYFNCKEYTENGCNNKWTRVIKVFKVEL
jgi:hypothetical protein